MSVCSECLGQRQYWTEWSDAAEAAFDMKALVVERPDPPDGTVLINCSTCGGLDMLRRAAILMDLATKHDEVRMCLVSVCARREVKGVGELYEKFPDDYLLLEEALINMVEEAGRVK